MKLNDKFLPTIMIAPEWRIYSQCATSIGVILDNKFDKPHINVYEHVRHSVAEVFHHPTLDTVDRTLSVGDLADEEIDVREILHNHEAKRRINIIGDVGVGKTTFIQHLRELHLKSPIFGAKFDIYIDFSDFFSTEIDPRREIRQKFENSVYAAFSKNLSKAERTALDREMLEKDVELFARWQEKLEDLSGQEREDMVKTAIRHVRDEQPLNMALGRLRQLCSIERNTVIIIVDNIDHLSLDTRKALFEFCTTVELGTSSLVVVAMRDHTSEQGFSAYADDKIVPAWNLRLKPPDVKLMLNRRINYFLPADGSLSTGTGVLRLDRSMAEVCRTLLQAPFSDPETYDFLINYCNYNIREVFAVLQRILSFHGFVAFDREILFSNDKVVKIGVDECLLAIGLGRHYMFYPDKSQLFNPYSSGTDIDPKDKTVGIRILQLLANQVSAMPYADILERLKRWGYHVHAAETQLRALVSKDLIWSSSGSPTSLESNSRLRLSYRGTLYLKTILRRAIYNYMMSFDMRAPSENHAVFRHHASEFQNELETFSSLSARFETAALVERVLGMADIVFTAETQEIASLRSKGQFAEFQSEISPRFYSLEIMEGLFKFLNKLTQSGNLSSNIPASKLTQRFVQPSTELLRTVGDRKTQYERSFDGVKTST